MTSSFLQMGFGPSVTAKSATPATDGYDGTFGGFPYNIHPVATPDVYAALLAAIADNDVTVTPYSPRVVSSAQLWANYQTQAQSVLTESDKTILRCYENGVTVPAAWATYRKALRAIISATSGDPAQPLPARPAYPAGT
ncbi:tail fiber assembly protein [Paraburkholderia elongata]|uniref:Uncharacterized protein n=1 Tax=Paraburkholderia elongata TaxID=2675747 RepID=A0A972NSR4_9BURK|nr:hypothetical protein [Paraburkholderia elongata]NPT59118.1 hypothetical protein [Paraburkholderia elongata]